MLWVRVALVLLLLLLLPLPLPLWLWLWLLLLLLLLLPVSYLAPLGRASVLVLPSFLEAPPVIDIGSRASAKASTSVHRRMENVMADNKFTVPATAGSPGEPQVGPVLPALASRSHHRFT